MQIAANMAFLGCHSKILCFNHIRNVFSSLSYDRAFAIFRMGHAAQNFNGRRIIQQIPVLQAIPSGSKDSSQLEGFSINSSCTDNSNEIKINVELSGPKTREIFDSVFYKMVADAQPIPGFRRVKGGKTPDIPQDVLLQVLGPSKVYKQVITKLINSTVAEYVQKEGLTVGEDLRVEQSFDELEDNFEPGDCFSFDAIVQLREST